MGSVFKKTFTKPLPAGAEIIVRKGERLARWRDSKGKLRTAPTAGDDAADATRIIVTVGTYTAKYRTGDGLVVEAATGCRDQDSARKVLGELERRAELVRAGVMTAAENAVADHQGTPLADHFAAYLDHLQAKGVHRTRLANARGRLHRIAAECSLLKLAHLSAAVLERWLHSAAAAGMSASNRNEYRAEIVGFGNWCVRTRFSPCRKHWSRFSTATCAWPAYRNGTNGGGRSTFTPCGRRSARCSRKAGWHLARHKPPCGIQQST